MFDIIAWTEEAKYLEAMQRQRIVIKVFLATTIYLSSATFTMYVILNYTSKRIVRQNWMKLQTSKVDRECSRDYDAILDLLATETCNEYRVTVNDRLDQKNEQIGERPPSPTTSSRASAGF
jgi:hypothetical protein